MKIESQNIELYSIIVLCVTIIWLIYNAIQYYKGEKRKIKHLHRFAKDGELESQEKLAQRYETGNMIIQDYERAAFWYQNAAFNTNLKSKERLRNFLDKRDNLKKYKT